MSRRSGAGVLGLVVAGAVAFAIDPPPSFRSLVTRALPGFTVDVPDGHQALSGHDYTTGSLTVEIDDDNGVLVSWLSGDAGGDPLALMGAGVKNAAGPRLRSTHVGAIDGRDTYVIDLEGGATLYMTETPCDGRAVVVQTFGLSEAIHGRIVRSIVCKPELHAAEKVPIVVDPAGLPMTEEKDGHVVYSNGGTALLVAATLPMTVAHRALSGAVTSMLAGQGFDDVQVEPRGDDTIAFKGTIRGTKGSGLVRSITCGARSVLVMSFANENAPAALAGDLGASVAAARCR
jgi:hypothetical protein